MLKQTINKNHELIVGKKKVFEINNIFSLFYNFDNSREMS